ncbi:MAG: PaaI family thioesterase [Rhizomicrobium sp.]
MSDLPTMHANNRSSGLLGTHPLRFDEETRTAFAQFEASGAFTNFAGTVQGGLLGAMLDDVIGLAACAFAGPDRIGPTVQCSIQYMFPVMPGIVRGSARVVRATSRLLFLEGHLLDAKDRVAVHCTNVTGRR